MHCTDVVPEFTERRDISLVARSNEEKIFQLYASRQSHVVETRSPRAVIGEWSRQSPSTSQGARDEVPDVVRRWLRQSPSTRVVWTVPEQNGGLDSPRAQRWSGQSPSTRIIATVPEHKDSHLYYCFIYLFIYLFCQVQFDMSGQKSRRT